MDNWWKDPRLDDEGTYDYLIEELPQDKCYWSHFRSRCDSCGKEHNLNFISDHYFYCWDGWDSMSYTECWVCTVKNILYRVRRKIVKPFKTAKLVLGYSGFKFKAFKRMYKYINKNNLSV